MNDPASASYYPTGPETTPISAWHLWLPIFQKRGIDPATIPDFAPLLAPQGEGLPAWQRSGAYQAGLSLGPTASPGGLLDTPPVTPAAPSDDAERLQRSRLLGLLMAAGWRTAEVRADAGDATDAALPAYRSNAFA